jgi:hypothetical protein
MPEKECLERVFLIRKVPIATFLDASKKVFGRKSLQDPDRERTIEQPLMAIWREITLAELFALTLRIKTGWCEDEPPA